MSNVPSISVVLPAYDEEDCIGRVLEATLEHLPATFDDWEIVVVDDGSRDRTGELVAALAAREPRIRCVRHARNRGYGRAIDSGLRAATKELILYTDADGQFDVRDLPGFVEHLRATGADVVWGYRIARNDDRLRRLFSWSYNRLVRVLFGIPVRDVDCSFKLFRRHVVEAIDVECDDFFVDTEIVARVARAGFHTVEKGVPHHPRLAGESTVRASDVPRTLVTVFRMWLRFRLGLAGEGERERAARLARADSES